MLDRESRFDFPSIRRVDIDHVHVRAGFRERHHVAMGLEEFLAPVQVFLADEVSLELSG
jgi:hypothetical protein